MVAYNNSRLHNSYVRSVVSEALHNECIDEPTHAKILAAHHETLYTPNFFIRIGLVLLTSVIVVFSFGLIGLMFGAFGSFATFCLVMAIVSYGLLEMLVNQKHYYNAGVDNVLQIATLGLLVSAVLLTDDRDFLLVAVIALIASAWLAIRFTDAFMSIIAYISLLAVVFLCYNKLGPLAKATAPFVLMVVSALLFIIMKRLLTITALRFYHFCMRSVMICALVTLYASVNFFVVKEASNVMFDLQLSLADSIPLGWLFWVFTILIPLLYIGFGVGKKDLPLVRVGLALIAVTILTVRYYHSILPGEIAMLMGGIILITITSSLIKYLKTPRHGFGCNDADRANKPGLHLEALVIAQTFGSQQGPSTPAKTEFGGGSGGGGGATGGY
jgi:hypothetical protein